MDKRFCVFTVSRGCEDINDWVNYYINLGFDRIFIVDNNDKDKKYNINNEKVTTIENSSIHHSTQLREFIQGFFKNDYNYDYLLVCDDDEFLNLGEYKDIREFVNDYSDYDSISFRWDILNDNGYIYISDEPEHKSLREIYKTSSGKRDAVKTMYKLPKEYSKFNDALIKTRPKYNTVHKINYGKEIEIPVDICDMKHYITYCMERFLIKKANYIFTYNYLHESHLRYFLSFNEYSDEKCKAYVELCKKYGLTISKIDKDILDEHNISY